MRLSNLLVVASLLLTSASALAELHTAGLMTLPLLIGNTGREYREADGAPFVMLQSQKTGSVCSATMIDDGCVITAGHCNDDDMIVIGGEDVKKGYYIGELDKSKNIAFGNGKDGFDIRVFKLKYPSPLEQTSISRDDLAKERISVDMTNVKKAVYGSGISWGPNASGAVQRDALVYKRGSAEPEKIKVDETVDKGLGVRREAKVRIRGYGAHDDVAAQSGEPLQTKGDRLWVSRGPQIFVRGDSGVLLKYDGKFHGVLSTAGIHGDLRTLPSEAVRRTAPGQVFANDVMANEFTPIADHHADIINALDKLECKGHSADNYLEKSRKILVDEVKRQGSRFYWGNMDGDTQKAIATNLRLVAGVRPGHEVNVSDVKLDGKTLSFTLKWTDGKMKRDLKLELNVGEKIN